MLVLTSVLGCSSSEPPTSSAASNGTHGVDAPSSVSSSTSAGTTSGGGMPTAGQASGTTSGMGGASANNAATDGSTGGGSSSGTMGAGGAATGNAATTTGGPSGLSGYFVSPLGDDSNPGTEEAPFLTLAHARDVLRAESGSMTEDVHVYLRGGTYRLTETFVLGSEDSGKNGFRIIYAAFPNEVPVLTGSTQVTGWTAHDANIYKAPLERTTKLRNLYVNGQRAAMTSIRATSAGSSGSYDVSAGQADWAWASGSGADGIRYDMNEVPEIASNGDDLEIVNGTTWNENIVCTRGVTSDGGYRVLQLQQPYGAIAQLPGWNAGFHVDGTHTIYNAFEFLDDPGEFYFDKSTQTLYYYPRSGEDISTSQIEAPNLETLVALEGASKQAKVEAITFRGITFANTDYNLYQVAGSHGKASVQAATAFVAYGDGDWHSSQYEIIDTLPAVIEMNHADSIVIENGVIEHAGSEGITMVNDVSNVEIRGNVITDIAGSAITVGHPQHVYVGDGGQHARFAAEVEGICANNSITNNLLLNISSQPGFGGHSGITAFFVEGLNIEHNQIQTTAYNGISLGWGWRNFQDSTSCKDNNISRNRFIDTLSRLHDSGAIYTIGQMPGTTINENYVRGIPPATSGPTYGLHNDEGTAYIVENDNVLDISPDVTYTINAEDFGEKHDLTILRTYATVSRMGIDPPNSTIDPPVAVPDNVWAPAQYAVCLASGIQDEFRHIVSPGLVALADQVFPASCAAATETSEVPIRSSGSDSNEVWFAPAGTTEFVEGDTMTRASGTSTTLAVPMQAGSYKLFVLDTQGAVLGESAALLRVP